MLKKKNNIKFNSFEAVKKTAKVQSSSKFFPSWFKELPKIKDDNIFTVKGCVPFKEAMSIGYTIPLWADLKVEFELGCNLFDINGNKLNYYPIQYRDTSDKFLGKEFNGNIVERVEEIGETTFYSFPDLYFQFPEKEQAETLSIHSFEQVGNGCPYKNQKDYAIHKLHCPWEIETPKGWSVYIKPYANDFSMPLKILEGVIDTDTYQAFINFPFIWVGAREKNTIIPKGTPIAQVIPFKREKLGIEFGKINWDRQDTILWTLRSVFNDGYKKFFWNGKKENE